MKKVNVINGGVVNQEEFKKWCEENGRNPEHKLSFVEYAVEVLENEDAKELLRKIKNKEISLDKIEIKMFKKEEKEKETEVTDVNIEGLKMVLQGMIRFGHKKDKDNAYKKVSDKVEEYFKNIDREILEKMFETALVVYGKDLFGLLKNSFEVLEMFGE